MMMSLLIIYMSMIPFIKVNMYMLIQLVLILSYFLILFEGVVDFYSSISYFLGVDIYSYGFLLMSFLISSFMLISMINFHSFIEFFKINFMQLILLILIFSSLNFLYMYICFEFVLIPLLMLILGWGYQPERLIAGMYIFLYTILASLPLFLVLVFMYLDLGGLSFVNLSYDMLNIMMYIVITVVFLIKLPMYMFHFWLPKAHVQAPVSGSMILAALMLKIGGYGLIRVYEIMEKTYLSFSYFWFCISLVGSFLISMMCLIQVDIKCLVAYSSVSHMGMVVMGLMTGGSMGLYGSYFLMLGHGFCSSVMFYGCHLLYLRTGSRSLYMNKGLFMFMPSFSMFWFMICSFNMSCPPSINFISEFMILSNMMVYWELSSLGFFLISFFCACFSYYLFSWVHHGLFGNLYSFSSLNLIEILCIFMHIVPLIFISFGLCCFIY
nr:NADH dehydrogenase subunit 4 [Paradorydium reflexanum]